MQTLHFLKDKVWTFRFSTMLSIIILTPSSVMLVSSKIRCFMVDLYLKRTANTVQIQSSIFAFLLRLSLFSYISRHTSAFTSFVTIYRSILVLDRFKAFIDLWILVYLRIDSMLKIFAPERSKAERCFSFCFSTIGNMVALISQFRIRSISTAYNVENAKATLSL